MRDLEFLPPSYTRLHRWRRLVRMEVWVVLLLGGGLTLWTWLAQQNIHTAEASLITLQSKLSQSNEQIEQMERLESLSRQLRQKAAVLEQLGIHVDSSRLIGKIADAMPDTLSLLSLKFEVEEAPAAMVPRARPTPGAAPPLPKRRLRVRLQGVAPTDVELATFLTELNRARFLEHVTPTYVRDRREAGHVLREFELSFTINLGGTRS